MTEGRVLRLTPDGRLDAPDLMGSSALLRVLALLDAEGEAARVVGGAVRNALLGLPVTDIDITTTAEPAVVLARAKAARLRAIPTGLAHGTVTVLVEGTPFEVTTLRRDVETDGRHAQVRFSRDFAEDARRRDFTINALSVDAGGLVHDTVGGLADLAAGRVRFIGDADTRIREDYLRLMRFFRFHAAYATGALDPAGLAAAIRHRDALARLSRERIRAELLKLLVARGAAPVLLAMDAAGIATRILGGPADPRRFASVAARDAAPDALLRLAALAVKAPGDADRLRTALRLSNDESRRLAEAATARAALDPAAPPAREGVLVLLFTQGDRAARDGLALAAAEAPDDRQAGWAAAEAVVATEPRPRMPIGGADLMARGITSGRRIGAILKRLQAARTRRRTGLRRFDSTLR